VCSVLSVAEEIIGPNITEPPGIPVNILKFKLVDIFTAGSTKEIREAIVAEFCQHDTKLHVPVPLVWGWIAQTYLE